MSSLCPFCLRRAQEITGVFLPSVRMFLKFWVCRDCRYVLTKSDEKELLNIFRNKYNSWALTDLGKVRFN
jgi:Zn-finger protein